MQLFKLQNIAKKKIYIMTKSVCYNICVAKKKL